MRILTKDLVKKAIELARPSALAILNEAGTTWGPKWVSGCVKGPGLSTEVTFDFGEVSDRWEPEWGVQVKFIDIARTKMRVLEREGIPTSVLIATEPWRLEQGEYLYEGGVTRNGISVAVSGAEGRADEAIAEMVLSAIVMLAFMDVNDRVRQNRMQI